MSQIIAVMRDLRYTPDILGKSDICMKKRVKRKCVLHIGGMSMKLGGVELKRTVFFVILRSKQKKMCDDDVPALVVDNGSGMCKDGFAGDYPRGFFFRPSSEDLNKFFFLSLSLI